MPFADFANPYQNPLAVPIDYRNSSSLRKRRTVYQEFSRGIS